MLRHKTAAIRAVVWPSSCKPWLTAGAIIPLLWSIPSARYEIMLLCPYRSPCSHLTFALHVFPLAFSM